MKKRFEAHITHFWKNRMFVPIDLRISNPRTIFKKQVVESAIQLEITVLNFCFIGIFRIKFYKERYNY